MSLRGTLSGAQQCWQRPLLPGWYASANIYVFTRFPALADARHTDNAVDVVRAIQSPILGSMVVVGSGA